jgi:hypothetical protein
VHHPAVLIDRRFDRLHYLHGWWYGRTRFLDYPDVRIRLPGDVGGPWARARQALADVERDTNALMCELHPHLWAEYLAARDAQRAPALRQAQGGETLRRHFRLEALSAEAFGQTGLIELAIEQSWERGRVLGAYVRNGRLEEFRSAIRPWRTPVLGG